MTVPLLRMRIKHGARDHDVIFVAFYGGTGYQPHPVPKCCGFTVSTSTFHWQATWQPLEKLSSELVVLASRSTIVRVLVKSIKLWRRPLALGKRAAKKTTTMKTFQVAAGPSARPPLLPGLGILTRRRSYATFKTTSREYPSTSDGESKKKSTKASNQVRLADCLHMSWVWSPATPILSISHRFTPYTYGTMTSLYVGCELINHQPHQIIEYLASIPLWMTFIECLGVVFQLWFIHRMTWSEGGILCKFDCIKNWKLH